LSNDNHCIRISAQEPRDRVRFWNFRRRQSFGGSRMQKRRDIGHLVITQRQGRHPFVRPPLMNHLADQIALNVMRHNRRPHQIRPARPGRVRPVTKSTRLDKLFAPSLGGRVRCKGSGLRLTLEGLNRSRFLPPDLHNCHAYHCNASQKP
jgi:hypothetical protein